MNTLGTYGYPNGLEIWNGEFDLDVDLSSRIVVGHSVGAMFALTNRFRSGKGKIILINPLFPKRRLIDWRIRLKRTHRSEGTNPKAVHAKGARNVLNGIWNSRKLLGADPAEMMKRIPARDVTVIRGEEDEWICSKEAVDFIRGFGIELIEIPKAGHKWSQSLGDAVDKLFKTRF